MDFDLRLRQLVRVAWQVGLEVNIFQSKLIFQVGNRNSAQKNFVQIAAGIESKISSCRQILFPGISELGFVFSIKHQLHTVLRG